MGEKGEGGGWLDWVYPRDCLGCGEALEVGAGGWKNFCGDCAEVGIWRARPPSCPRCGHPYFGEIVQEPECVHCRGLEPAFGRGKTLLLLRDAGRDWIHELKYHAGRHLLDDLHGWLSERPDLARYIRHRTLVPVPLHPRKERERGYNQARWLAEALMDWDDTAWVEEPLKRVVDTPSQTLLGREERIRNLKYAFALRGKPLVSPKKSYLLIDDVFTTGATLNACARRLKEAGARDVDCFTLGHG